MSILNYFRKTLALVFLRGGGFLGGYVFTLLITSNFGAYGQGVFATSYMILLVISMFSKFGIDSSLVKFVNDSKEDMTNGQILFLVNIFSFIASLILASVVFFLSDYIAFLFSDKMLVGSIKIATVSIPFFVFIDINSTYFKATFKPLLHSFFVQFLKMVLACIIFYFLITFSDDKSFELILQAYLLSLIIGSILVGFILVKFLHKEEKKFLHEISVLVKDKIRAKVKKILRVSSPMLLSSGIVLLMGWLDTFILAVFESTEDVGLYNVASKLAVALTFVYSSVASIEMPSIAKLYSSNELEKLKENLKKSYFIIFVLTLPAIIVLVFFGKQILGIFGEEFVAAYPVLIILMVGQSFNSLSGFVGPLFQMTGLEVKLQNILILTCLLNIILNILFVNLFGVIGVSIATAFCLIFWNLVGFFYLRSKINISTIPLI